jgi:hypothetical protein
VNRGVRRTGRWLSCMTERFVARATHSTARPRLRAALPLSDTPSEIKRFAHRQTVDYNGRTMDAMRENAEKTYILLKRGEEDEEVGYLADDGTIYRRQFGLDRLVGRVDRQGRLFRQTSHAERELGTFTKEGHIFSHGLFEGGAVGWVDPDGAVVQAGLILGEEEVGRVEGPQLAAGAAALLLLFLPDEREAEKQMRGL